MHMFYCLVYDYICWAYALMDKDYCCCTGHRPRCTRFIIMWLGTSPNIYWHDYLWCIVQKIECMIVFYDMLGVSSRAHGLWDFLLCVSSGAHGLWYFVLTVISREHYLWDYVLKISSGKHGLWDYMLSISSRANV